MSTSQRSQIIPLDGAIKDFKKHLKSHPRTILSARFGDGKSFFLAAAQKELKRWYSFLTIYPVNYQVAENQDIFEYIKRDILFQLYERGMVPNSYAIPDDIASYFFLRKNWKDFATEVLEELSLFDETNAIKATVGAAKFLKSMKVKYEAFKNNGGEIGANLDWFLESFDRKGIYEADPITAILSDIIKSWRSNNRGQKLCLVFEDMDRIDPAHLFRILNVISAHMDYGYKYGLSPSSRSLVGNKFGVDNIVICLDYCNLKAIFHHFYGQKASFEGYINKFSDKGIFHYSLNEQVTKYYLDELIRITRMNSEAVLLIMEEFDIASFTLRQLYRAIDGVGQQITIPKNNNGIVFHRGLLVIAAILCRLGLTSDEIVDRLSSAFRTQPMIIGSYLASFMMLRRGVNQVELEFSFGEKSDGYYVGYLLVDYHHDGCAFFERRLYAWHNGEHQCNPEEEIRYMMKLVGR